MRINYEKLYWFVLLPLFVFIMTFANTEKMELLNETNPTANLLQVPAIHGQESQSE